MLLSLTQHLTANKLDEVIRAGPVMPFHTGTLQGEVHASPKPFQGSRWADFQMKPIIGDPFFMHYAVVATRWGVYVIMGRAPTARAATARAHTQHALKSLRITARGDEMVKAADVEIKRQEAVRAQQEQQRQAEEKARRERFSHPAGLYERAIGPVDGRTSYTAWLCDDGTYVLTERYSVVSPGIVSSGESQVTGRGTWRTSEDGAALLMQQRNGAVTRYSMTVHADRGGGVAGLTLNGAYWTRSPTYSGCHN